ncbi:response regulator with CheY-like receiver domain and winged-helix DNA-binding domain [Candidatus Methanoperedens nitroreducens]|uniref:Response regulator with CheY-like receiver domain and winged-helix DNA-binding domain n=1 Tax=Candidatus Methanoperedens nitratireducens TaxID=1392998 RepID=A0A062V8P8_9EURY|nr:response regulator [Candidatus Methanoperedens nitroreducens]KCZ72134.1 response regulator with CheY-like receiver domain and winged-helix DNA-binding domain [Candidatus Methanoperedens nitroreducens]MDJ1421889.1 response regulator [Candidatus Methanoperedens sp.]
MDKDIPAKEVLIVDDEPDTLELVKLVLENGGFKALLATSGTEALVMIEASKPDLVLLDIMMPDMDGWEIFRRIKDKYPDIPVAILTAKTQNIDKLLGLHVLKADDYITKPFGKNELIDRVRKLTGLTEFKTIENQNTN